MSVKRILGIWLLAIGCMTAYAQTPVEARPYFAPGASRAAVDAVFSQSDIDSLVSKVRQGEKIQIVGVASPEGNARNNARLAKRRAQTLLRQMKKATGLPDSAFAVGTQVLSWQHLSQYVERDSKVPSRDSVLSLLQGADTLKHVTRQLRKLSGGTPYLYIKEHILPLMRTSVTAPGSERPQFSVAQSLEVAQGQNLWEKLQAKVKKAKPEAKAKPKPEAKPKAKPEAKAKSKPEAKPKAKAKAKVKAEKPKAEPIVADKTKGGAAPDTAVRQERPDSDSAVAAANVAAVQPVVVEKKASTWWYWVAIIALLCLLLGTIAYYRRKLSEKEDELQIAKQQVAVSEKELASLKSKVEVQEDAITKQYDTGQSLYRHLQEGGLATNWTNEQIFELSNYYRIVNPKLMSQIAEEYDQLSPNNMLYMILLDMGKSDADIQQIMGISQTTIRSIRFRIKSKKRKGKGDGIEQALHLF